MGNDEEQVFCKSEEREEDETLDALIGFVASLPHAKVKLLNIPVYMEMMRTAARLKKVLAQAYDSFEIEVKVDELFNLGCVSAEIDDLTVYSPEIFAKAVSQADNFEVYRLANEKLRLDISFQRVLKSAV